MKKLLMTIAAAGLILAPATSVLAQNDPPPAGAVQNTNNQGEFDSLDVNKDGKLTPDELPSVSAEDFARYDTNGDGALDIDEANNADLLVPPEDAAPQ